MSEQPTVYLCGPIQHAQDDGKGWRAYVRESYGHEFDFNDPWSKYDDEATNSQILDPGSEYYWSDVEIMEGDREQIDEADALLIHYAGESTWGSPREHEYVSEWGRGPDIPVVIQLSDEEFYSPWMHDAYAVVKTFEEAFTALRTAVGGGPGGHEDSRHEHALDAL